MEQSLVLGIEGMLHWQNLIAVTLGVIFGIIVGMIPGLTVSLGTVLILPVTFVLPPTTSIALLLGIYAAGMVGGSISAILLNIPGTPAASATVLDGYPLALKGMGIKAMQMAIGASFFGGIVSMIVLMLTATQIAKISLKFGAVELAALIFMGLTFITIFSERSMLKGLISGLLGLVIMTVGMDPISGFNRFTLGIEKLATGVHFLPAMVGLFALPEIIKCAAKYRNNRENGSDVQIKVGPGLKLREYFSTWRALLLGSFSGTIIGAIPGASAPVAAFISYSYAKKISPRAAEFGEGSLEGIAAPESANNAVTGGALIPLLTLGIPGDTVTAVLLGALMIQGLAPGPLLIRENPGVIYAVYGGLITANVITLLFALLAAKYFAKIRGVQHKILMPVIGLMCVIGSYAFRSSMFDVGVMVFFGILGYLMLRFGYPVVPLLLAIILGPNLEVYTRQALIINGENPMIFFQRPISLLFILLAMLPIVFRLFKSVKLGRVLHT